MINEDFTLICVETNGRKRLTFMAPKRYQKFVDTLGEGQELRCKFTDPVRGLKHNSKLHAVIGEAAEVLGWEDPTEFKEQLLIRLRPEEEDPVTGFMRRKRTRDMTNEEIDQLVMEIKAFVQHLMPGYIFRFDFELQPEQPQLRRGARQSGSAGRPSRVVCTANDRDPAGAHPATASETGGR